MKVSYFFFYNVCKFLNLSLCSDISEESARLTISQSIDIKEEIITEELFDDIGNNLNAEEQYAKKCNDWIEPTQGSDAENFDDNVEDDFDVEEHFSENIDYITLSDKKNEVEDIPLQFSSQSFQVPNDMNPKVVLEKLPMCDICEKSFDSSRALRHHKKSEHNRIVRDSKIKESSDLNENPLKDEDLPAHEFLLKYTMKDDPKWSISLIIKPYVYAQKRSSPNGKTYWYCIQCKEQDCITEAISMKLLDSDGKPNHGLQSADPNHICNPCPSYHLQKKFTILWNNSIHENPDEEPRKLYEKTKQDICDLIDDENVKLLFLDKIPTFANMWKNIYYNRNLVHPKIVEKRSVRKCAMCDFESLSNDEFKTHIKNMHRGMKPHSKARLESHKSTGHLNVKGK